MAGNILSVGLALIFVLALAAGVSFVGWSILQSAKSDGKVDYCLVKQNTDITGAEFEVYGHRPWRPDMKIATFKSVADAEEWRSHKCPR